MDSAKILHAIRADWAERSEAISHLDTRKRQEREKMFQLLAAQENVILKLLDVVRGCYALEEVVLPAVGVRLVHPIALRRGTLFFDPGNREFYLQAPSPPPHRCPEPILFRGCRMRRQLLSEPFLLEELLRNTRYFERYIADCVSATVTA